MSRRRGVWITALTLTALCGCGEDRAAEGGGEAARAWLELETALARARESVEADASDARDLADGYRYLLYVLNETVGEALVTPTDGLEFWHHGEGNELMACPNPDQDYWVAQLHPDATYRVSGDRGGAVFLSFVIYGQEADESSESEGWSSTVEATQDSRELSFDPDGRFEVILSATRPEEAVDWIPLSPRARELYIREFQNRRGEPAQIEIERIDGSATLPPLPKTQGFALLRSPKPFYPGSGDEEVARRIRLVAKNFDAIVQFAEVPKLMRLASNKVFLPDPDRKGANQVYPNPLVDYALAWLDLEPGEALVVEGKAPAATPYWMVQFCDRYMSSPGGRRVGFVNNLDAPRQPDGSFRLVFSPEDPGVPGWVDTSGRSQGWLLWRFVKVEAALEAPEANVVQLAELR